MGRGDRLWRFDLSKVRFREIEGGTLGACLPTEGGGEKEWKESRVRRRDVRSVGRVLDGACPRLLITSRGLLLLECLPSLEIRSISHGFLQEGLIRGFEDNMGRYRGKRRKFFFQEFFHSSKRFKNDDDIGRS